MKNLILVCFSAAVLLLISACSNVKPENYTLDKFMEGMKLHQGDPVRLYDYCAGFYKNSEDIDALRNATSIMFQLQPDKALSLLKDTSDKRPEDKTALYLYARLLEDKAESVKLSRKVIELDPEWEFGYRLITVNYMQYLFSGKGDFSEILGPMLQEDEKYFEKFKTFKTSDDIQSIVYFRYLVYRNDPEALNFALKASENKESWADDNLLGEAYTVSGQYEKAAERFSAGITARQPGTPDNELRKYSALSVFYKLQEMEKYAEAHDYIMTGAEDLEERDRYACSGILYSKQGEVKKAVSYLQKAAAMGYDDYFSFERDDDLDEVKKTKEWPEIERVIKANYAANSGRRKESALAAKFSKPAPASTFTDTEKKEITLESLKGNIVILDFWATWCGPCRMAMPVLSAFAGKNIEGVKVFSVNVWEQDPEAAEKFFEEQKYSMQLVYGEKDSSEKFGFNGIPYICVIDKEGNIRYQENGYSPELEEKLEWWIEDLKGK